MKSRKVKAGVGRASQDSTARLDSDGAPSVHLRPDAGCAHARGSGGYKNESPRNRSSTGWKDSRKESGFHWRIGRPDEWRPNSCSTPSRASFRPRWKIRRLTEAAVIKALMRRDASSSSGCQPSVRIPKWSVRTGDTRRAVANEKTPLACALEFARSLPARGARSLHESTCRPR